MRDLWISLNEKYQRNKSKIWFAIAVVVFFLLVTRDMDKMLKTSGGSGNKTATSGSGYSSEDIVNEIKNATSSNDDDYNSIMNELSSVKINDESAVILFIEMCNNNKFKSAYEMLSEDCKKLLYPTEEKFIKSYGNTIYKNYKYYSISGFYGNTYKIDYKEDAITTGGSTGSISSEYITVTDDEKLNISGFISKQELSIKSNNPYFSAEITGKTTYVDHEVYQIKIKNIVKADIYVNETINNGLYIIDSAQSRIDISTGEYIDQEYFIPSETTKVLNLRFNKSYNNSRSDVYMNFQNIKVVNKSYYNYETRKTQMTNYPEKTSCVINMQ